MSTPRYYKEERPWGSFERFTDNEVSTVKLIHMAPGKRLSLQRHKKRAEFWRAVDGSGKATIDGVAHPLNKGDEVTVPLGALHRLEGGPEGLTVLEIITGEYDENDIERIEDDFGRASS
jgi:mannose-6-phosphate isomerase-like protein (cupin superfamily)